MVFNKDIPGQNSSQLQSQQQKLAFGFDPIYQKRNTAEISQKLEKQFQILIEKTSALIFVIQERKICYANPITELTIGFSRSQLLQSDLCLQLTSQGYEPDCCNSDRTYEVKIKTKNNRECWLNCSCKPIEWQNQPATMITAVDITKYKLTTAKIHRQLIAEKEICNNRARFVSMVSHEFRTPLNIISFSTSLLIRHLHQWTETKQLKYLKRLQTSVEQLGNLMDEVLIIGRVEAGKLEFNPQPLNLISFCQELLIEVDLSQLNRLNVEFVNLFECETILADKNLLKLVLVNLLANAVKYSPDDSAIKFIVSCECSIENKKDNGKRIIFKVIDRGIGIPFEEQPKIFEPFHRSKNVGDIPGNGLGLAIAKKLVELQGGQITLKSDIGMGSTFIVKIPYKSA